MSNQSETGRKPYVWELPPDAPLTAFDEIVEESRVLIVDMSNSLNENDALSDETLTRALSHMGDIYRSRSSFDPEQYERANGWFDFMSVLMKTHVGVPWPLDHSPYIGVIAPVKRPLPGMPGHAPAEPTK